MSQPSAEGILLVNKPAGRTSFSLVGALRRILNVRKIGHAGTLDPFATGVMVMLIGKNYTKLSDQFLHQDKEYSAELYLGVATDTFDTEGKVIARSDIIPSMEEIERVIAQFQGEISQVPPMFSAKKIGGKKLCDLARKGENVERAPVKVHVKTELLHYEYPVLKIGVACSKGTYIRSIADDMGKILGCGAHLTALKRTRSGPYRLSGCFEGSKLFETSTDRDEIMNSMQAV